MRLIAERTNERTTAPVARSKAVHNRPGDCYKAGVFSRRTAWTSSPSPFAAAIASARAEARTTGRALLDLSVSNPTTVDLLHPPSLYESLGDPGDARYEPASRGLHCARRAIADYYASQRDLTIDPSRICLSASTSEAYAAAFSILADPGDTVLIPSPSYPLLGYLADLAAITLVPYRLAYDGAWHVDLADLRERLAAAARPRAIVAIAPNNPTGNYLDPATLAALDNLAAERSLAVIVDEVFFDYPLVTGAYASPLGGHPKALTFTLSGLSKIAALPQMKLAWTIVDGPPALAQAALSRLEIVHDTFLSASTPTQRAAPVLLAAVPAIQASICARLRANVRALGASCRGSALTPCAVEGGWTALVRLPQVGLDDLEWARLLLARAGVITQPGYLFDLETPHLALSLITPEATFRGGVEGLVNLAQQVVGSGP